MAFLRLNAAELLSRGLAFAPSWQCPQSFFFAYAVATVSGCGVCVNGRGCVCVGGGGGWLPVLSVASFADEAGAVSAPSNSTRRINAFSACKQMEEN